MKFAGIQKSSTVDYPGRLSAVLFAPGCDLDCFYCHNRALLSPGAALLAQNEAWAFLEKRRGLLDGVVLSGGEPILQPGVAQTCARLKAMGYAVKLDTNGQHPGRVKALLEEGLLDYIAVDVKALPEQYPRVTRGGSFEAALACLALAKNAGVAHEARTTVYPGLDGAALLTLASLLPPLPLWRLNPYRVPERFHKEDALWVRAYALSARELEGMLSALAARQPSVTV